MRLAKKQVVEGDSLSVAQMDTAGRKKAASAMLLYVLNMGKKQLVPAFIAYEAQARPSQFVPEIQERVISFVGLVQETLASFTPLDRTSNADFQVMQERERRMREINKSLSRCLLTPTLRVSWRDGSTVFADETPEHSENLAEALSLLAVRMLAANGEVHRLRRCEIDSCGRWFIATREKNTFCSVACRQRKFQSTEVFKERRRKSYQSKKAQAAGKAALKAKQGGKNAKTSK